MNIIFLTCGDLAPAEYRSWLLAQARIVAAQGHDVSWVDTAGLFKSLFNGSAKREIMGDAEQVFSSTVNLSVLPFGDRYLIHKLSGIFRHYSPDIIHACGARAAWLALSARDRLYERGPKIVMDSRGAWAEEKIFHKNGSAESAAAPDSFSLKLHQMEAEAVRRSDSFICSTARLAAYYGTAYGRDLSRASIIPGCINSQKYLPNEEERKNVRRALDIENETVWLYSAFNPEIQSVEENLSVMKSVLESDENSRLIILCNNTGRYLDLVREYELPEDKVILPSVDYESIPGILQACDAALWLCRDNIASQVASPTLCSACLCSGLPMLIGGGLNSYCELVDRHSWGAVAHTPERAAEVALELHATLPISHQKRQLRSERFLPMAGWDAFAEKLITTYERACSEEPRWCACVFEEYPRTTDFGVEKEIDELCLRGLDARSFSILPSREVFSRGESVTLSSTRILPGNFSLEAICANFDFFRRDHSVYGRWLWKCISEPCKGLGLRRRLLRGIGDFWAAASLARMVRREPGRVHFHAWGSGAEATTALVASAYLHRTFSFRCRASGRSNILREKISSSSFVACASIETYTCLQEKFPDFAEQMILGHPGVYRQGLPVRDSYGKSGYIVCAGDLSERRGVDIVLQALAILADKDISFHCDFAGDGPLRKWLGEESIRLGLKNKVRFLGIVPHEKLLGLMEKASLFIDASRPVEGGATPSYSILEAAAVGVPLAVSNIACLNEIFAEKGGGRMFPPESPGELAKAAEELLVGRYAGLRMARRARDAIREKHSLASQARLLSKRINAILEPLSERENDVKSEA